MKKFYISYSSDNNGYVAVVSAIIITAIITLVALATSNSSFFGRYDTETLEFKSISHQVAQGCLDHARLKLAMGLYSGNENVTIGSYTCHVYAITTNGTQKILQAKATVSNETTNLQLTINALSFATISLVELNSI